MATMGVEGLKRNVTKRTNTKLLQCIRQFSHNINAASILKAEFILNL